jgi:hypothetical protein
MDIIASFSLKEDRDSADIKPCRLFSVKWFEIRAGKNPLTSETPWAKLQKPERFGG